MGLLRLHEEKKDHNCYKGSTQKPGWNEAALLCEAICFTIRATLNPKFKRWWLRTGVQWRAVQITHMRKNRLSFLLRLPRELKFIVALAELGLTCFTRLITRSHSWRPFLAWKLTEPATYQQLLPLFWRLLLGCQPEVATLSSARGPSRVRDVRRHLVR